MKIFPRYTKIKLGLFRRCLIILSVTLSIQAGMIILGIRSADAGPACNRTHHEILEYSKEIFEKKSFPADTLRLWPLSFNADITGEGDKDLKRDVDWEGFVTSPARFLQLIPGVGLGIHITKRNVLYVCLHLEEENQNFNQVQVLVFKQSVLFSNMSIEPVSLQIRPLKDGELLWSHLMGALGLKAEKLKLLNFPSIILGISHSIFEKILGIGVSQVIIQPDRVDVYPAASIFGARIAQGSSIPVAIESSWLKNSIVTLPKSDTKFWVKPTGY